MNREIKFRAYDKKLNVMAYDFDQSLVNHYPKRLTIGASIHQLVMDVGLLYGTLDQYTGLKDDNGVEIYNGDILESHHFTDSDGEHKLRHVIEWSDKLSGWIAKNTNSMDVDDGSVQLWVYLKSDGYKKVIGNIHQNSELLK